MKLIINKGGEGSGNFDHAGRPGLVGGSASQGSYAPKYKYNDDPNDFVGKYPEALEAFESAADLKALSAIKRDWRKRLDASYNQGGSSMEVFTRAGISEGALEYFNKKMREVLRSSIVQPRSAADARADRILHLTNSEGKKVNRKW